MSCTFQGAARTQISTKSRRPIAIVSFLSILFASAAGHAAPLTLEQAIALAEQGNPALRSVRAAQSAARGEWEEAQAPLWNNPQLGTEYRRRQLAQPGMPDARRQDGALAVSQTFEIGGQPGARRVMADAGLRALNESIEDSRREIRAETEQRFVRLLGLQARLEVERQSLDLLERAAELVGKRVRAGEDSRLDGNLARVEAERAINQVAQVEEQLSQARADLAAFIQWWGNEPLEAVGELDAPAPAYSLADLLARAARRPKLRALQAQEEAAASRLELERGARLPDISVGLAYSPESGIDGKDRITTLSLSLPLPLFRQNQAGIGKARSELDQARIERQAAESNTQTGIAALWARRESLMKRVSRLRQAVLPSLEENQNLSLKALRAGEIGLAQFLLVRRQVLDGRRDLLDAQGELREVQASLESAAGWPGELPTETQK